jgi:nucleoredoxin
LFSTTSNDPLTVKAALPSVLIDAQGNVVDSAETLGRLVENKRVALYFAAGWCPDCRDLDFILPQYRKALNESNQPIQLIYVPSDNTLEEQLRRMQELELDLGVPIGEAADTLKKQYGVWPDAEIEKFGGFVREFIDDFDDDEMLGGGAAEEGVEGEMQDTELADEMMVEGDAELMQEGPEDDSGRRSGIPAFVVLDNQGAEFAFLNTEADSIMALADWPVDDPQGIW